MKDKHQIELTPEELDGLIHRLDAGTLTEKDHEVIKALIEAFLMLSRAAQDKDARINKLLRMLFGAKTEKADKILPAHPEEDKADEKPEGEDSDAGDKPKGHGRNGACEYTAAEKITVPYPGLKPGDNCPLCPGGKVYPWEPGMVVRFTGGAPLQAKIWELEKLRCNLCGEIFSPQLPGEAGDKKYDESAGAMVALLRYGSGVPFNRIEQLQESMGIPLPASTQWEIVKTAAEPASYAYGELARQGAQGSIIHNDDTPMKILSMVKDEDDERKGIFTTGLVSVTDDRKIVLFMTGRKHAGENMTDLLGFRDQSLGPPLQMCDALSRNISKAFGTILCNCMSHGRRNFVDVVSSFPEECGHVIETVAVVYKNDETAKKQNMTPNERLLYHQAQSGPLMDGLFAWMKDQMDGRKAEPNSGLGKAISYMLNHWEPLTRFLRVEGAPLDNNLCERVLKMAILHRKNSLFFKTLRGARVGDIFMSLIHTCRLSNVNPFDYLVALQKHAAEVARNPKDWLPWNYTAAAAMLQPA